jgi:hypothetical protein
MIRHLLVTIGLVMAASAAMAKPLDGWIYLTTVRGAKYYLRPLKESPNDPQVIAEVRMVDNVDDISRPYLFDCATRKMGPLNRKSGKVITLSNVSAGSIGESWFSAACIAKGSSNPDNKWIFLASHRDEE